MMIRFISWGCYYSAGLAFPWRKRRRYNEDNLELKSSSLNHGKRGTILPGNLFPVRNISLNARVTAIDHIFILPLSRNPPNGNCDV